MGVQVVWLFDGVSLPGEDAKPYMTIEQMPNDSEKRGKERTAFEATHRFQVGLFARTANERATLQTKVARHFMFDAIPLIDLAQPTRPVVGFFNTRLTGVTPISAESTDMKSQYHRVYFDIEVDATYYA